MADTPITGWPKQLTPALRDILGFMCFQLGGPAHVYRDAGEFVGSDGALEGRAEDEQAFMLHKMIGFLVSDGPEGWRSAAKADINRAAAIVRAKRDATDG